MVTGHPDRHGNGPRLMAEGIRIRHHTRRSQMLPVPLLHRPWSTKGRPDCGICHTVHPCKVIHLNLDDTGAVIVSHQIRADLWRVPQNAGFTMVNTVADPPPQGIHPETVKVKLRGVEIGGGLERTEPNRRYATTPKATPSTRTVGLDEYVDVANRRGITTDTALNVLMANLVGLVRKGHG